MSAEPIGVSTDEEPGPDYRFTLANERTFLAWNRTALAIAAGGIAVQQVSASNDVGRVLVLVLSASCLITALVLTLGASAYWRRSQAAIQRGQPLPGTRLIPALSAGLALLMIAGTALVLVA